MADDLLSQIRLNGAVPRHVAVIMDGNGRWARERSLPRPLGHRAGMKAVREAVEGALEAGVEVLTLFAFSEENWQRPVTEISALMQLLEEYIAREVAELKDQGVAVHVLGDRTRLAPGARAAVERIERETHDGARLALNLCISYSSRGELARAARLLAEEVLKGLKRREDIDEDAIGAKLYTAPWSDPALLSLTSGECRLSPFLLWPLAYTELYITPVRWSDVRRRDRSRPTGRRTTPIGSASCTAGRPGCSWRWSWPPPAGRSATPSPRSRSRRSGRCTLRRCSRSSSRSGTAPTRTRTPAGRWPSPSCPWSSPGYATRARWPPGRWSAGRSSLPCSRPGRRGPVPSAGAWAACSRRRPTGHWFPGASPCRSGCGNRGPGGSWWGAGARGATAAGGWSSG